MSVSREELINKFIQGMREYQRINNIERECCMNTKLVYEMLQASNIENDFKIQPCFAIFTREDKTIIVVHLVIDIDGSVIDPSYEVYSKEDVEYYKTINDFKRALSHPHNSSEQISRIFSREYITKFLQFVQYAKNIMDGCAMSRTAMDYYYAQREYAKNYMLANV